MIASVFKLIGYIAIGIAVFRVLVLLGTILEPDDSEQKSLFVSDGSSGTSLPLRSGEVITVTGIGIGIDGSTLRINDETIVLYGIDAPKSGQLCSTAALNPSTMSDRQAETVDCAIAAKYALRALIIEGGGKVMCAGRRRGEAGRSLSVCESSRRIESMSGFDLETGTLNLFMVALGWALAHSEYFDVHIELENSARNAKRGIWAGAFEPPMRKGWMAH